MGDPARLERSASSAGLGELDWLTRWAALAISRRTLLKGTAGSAAMAIGLGWFSPRVAAADNCHTCNGPCGLCKASVGCCTSPNRQYTWCNVTCHCILCQWDSCLCLFAWLTVCDSGAYAAGCNEWCWC